MQHANSSYRRGRVGTPSAGYNMHGTDLTAVSSTEFFGCITSRRSPISPLSREFREAADQVLQAPPTEQEGPTPAETRYSAISSTQAQLLREINAKYRLLHPGKR